jgi:DNA-binding HxlR family transcriptional regulator
MGTLGRETIAPGQKGGSPDVHIHWRIYDRRVLLTRPGAEALSLLAAPLNVHTLEALQRGPMGLPELHRAIGSPPQSTMRVYTRRLEELDLLESHRRKEFPTGTDYGITEAGRSLLGVAAFLQDWLGEAPDGPILLDSIAGKSGTKALVGGWSSNIVRAVAARPLSLTDLNMLIPKISYPSLERKLSAMRSAKLVEPEPGNPKGIPYRATDWLRRAVVPLTSAVAWGLQYTREPTSAICRIDVEAAFLLAFPIISLGSEVTGRCRLSVEVQGGSSPTYAGALVSIERGRVVSCSSNLEGDAHASVSGTPVAWLRQMNGGPHGGLEVDGSRSFAEKLTGALRAMPKTAKGSSSRPEDAFAVSAAPG